MSRQSLRFLDGIRGLAALYVVIGHARALLWEGFASGYAQHPALYSLPEKLLAYTSFLFVFGRQAVILFFVLSGFLIHLRYAKQVQSDASNARFDWLHYMARRIRRIYPALLFAVILTFCVDSVGQAQGYEVYQSNNLHAGTALGTLLMVGTFYVPQWGTDAPLWSLTYEWWFYMLYPLCWWITKRSIKLTPLLLIVGFGLSVIQLQLGFFANGSLPILALLNAIMASMIVWWFGALLADIYVGRIKFEFDKLGWLIVVLPLALYLPHLLPNFLPMQALQDVLCGLAFTGLLAICLVWQQKGRSLRLLERLKPLGDCSYTLYVTHYPILVLMGSYLMSRSPASRQHFDWFVLGIIMCVVLAYIAHFVVERPFMNVRASTVTEAKGVVITTPQ